MNDVLKERKQKVAQKYWWRVFLRKDGKIIDGCRKYAATRRLAKEMAAQQWGVSELATMTAIKDADAYELGEA